MLPQTAWFLSNVNLFPQFFVENQPVEKSRQFYAQFTSTFDPVSIPMEAVEDVPVDVEFGRILIRKYIPYRADQNRALLYFHGGGFTLGSVHTHDQLCRRLAKALRLPIYSVEYSLAPEAKFPSQIDEAFKAYRWVLQENTYDKIYVGGDSAGANLSAVVAVKALEKGLMCPEALLMLYPLLDLSLSSSSMSTYSSGYFLTKKSLEYYRENYLRDLKEVHRWETSPLLATPLNRVSKIIVISAEYDPLKDDAELLEQRLPRNVLHYRAKGVIHGFMQMPLIYPRQVDSALNWLNSTLNYKVNF